MLGLIVTLMLAFIWFKKGNAYFNDKSYEYATISFWTCGLMCGAFVTLLLKTWFP
jgi:hypothetical protein